MSIFNRYPHHLKRHYNIESKEKKSMFMSAGIIALTTFLFIWKNTAFTLLSGILNIALLFVAAAIVLWILIAAAKAIAIWKRYTASYTSWMEGLLVGFVISFLSYGYLPVLFPGVIEIQTIERLRHGKEFPGENVKDISFVLTGTIYVLVLVSLVFQQLTKAIPIQFFKYCLLISGLILFFAMLPIPHNIGLHLFYSNRKRYYFTSFFVIGFLLALIFGSSYSIAIAIAVGLVFFFILKDPKHNFLEREVK